jgi:hypothetical protein
MSKNKIKCCEIVWYKLPDIYKRDLILFTIVFLKLF